MPPHASLSLSLSLSLSAVLCLSCLSCLTPPPALPRLLLSWSVCRPYLTFQTTTASCTSCTLSFPLSLFSNPGDGPRCFLSWRVALVQIVSTGRLPLRKNTNLWIGTIAVHFARH
ncbi:hypothetical protein CCUS01_09378 [Colletotrichum cuscutae]|uniref:Secreted protein n=1 Tax=Colletotrichum cuscutae TaxID=1209917 RepID=A0AAI9XSY9_9PEZI|nr:hypothetical protein CCUS01_09378 [Colletotrichum cuscutae]